MARESDAHRLARLVLDEFKQVRERFDGADQRLDRIDAELATLNRNFDRMDEAISSMRGFAKEIDETRARIREIERHLGLSKNIAA